MNDFGNTVVHAPSNHGLQITSPASTTLTSNTFLEMEDVNILKSDNINELELDDSENGIEKKTEQKLKQIYSFLN